jgi:hypothetical protein
MNMKRMRGRTHRNSGGGGGGSAPRQYGGNIPLNRNHVFDSSGPDLRIRGTAQQLFEKYLQLGRDATGSGDRVMAESYFQYAEHYFRIVGAINQASQQNPQHQQGSQNGQGQNGHTQNGQNQNGQTQNGQTHQAPQQNAQRRHERDGYEGEDQQHQGPGQSNGPQAGYGDQPSLDVPNGSEG